MKQIQTIIALMLLCTTANAQNIQGSYQPKADGQVSKQQEKKVKVMKLIILFPKNTEIVLKN